VPAVTPGSRLIINVDLRHPDAEVLDQMDTAFRDLVDRECRQRGLEFEVSEAWYMPVTRFAPQCVEAVRNATAMLGYSNMEMVSGAGQPRLRPPA